MALMLFLMPILLRQPMIIREPICPHCSNYIFPGQEHPCPITTTAAGGVGSYAAEDSVKLNIAQERIAQERIAELTAELAVATRALEMVCEAWDGLNDPWNDQHRTVEEIVALWRRLAQKELSR